MNLDNITEGLIVKNYKELVLLLGEEVKSGKSKQIQMNDFERYFEYEKQGNKFIITKIYRKPKEKISNKSSVGIMSRINQGEYSKEMFPLIKNFVAKNPELEYCPKGTLMRTLKLKNNNYDIARNYPKQVAEYLSKVLKLPISREDIDIITYSIYSNATDKINNAFKNLEKMKYIYAYTDKLMTIYEKEHYSVYIPMNSVINKMEQTIMVSRIKILEDYYLELGQLEDCREYIDILKDKFGDDIDSINKELKIQVFLKGLFEEVKKESLHSFKEYGIEDRIDNYFYSYGYIRNEDIEWDKEILDLTKENIHLENYKSKVKNDYIASTFASNYTKKYKDNKNKIHAESILRKELILHMTEFKEKSDILFELFTGKNPYLKLNIVDIFKVVKDEKSDDSLPF
jgi:hypothetical protein